MLGLINPKVVDETTQEVDNFRKTHANFANIQISPEKREHIAPDDEYEYCPNCSRKFFTGRLKLHLKSCKDGKPLKPLKNKTSRDKFMGSKETLEEGDLANDVQNVFSSTRKTQEEGNEGSFGIDGGDTTRDKSQMVESSKSSQLKMELERNKTLESSLPKENFSTPQKKGSPCFEEENAIDGEMDKPIVNNDQLFDFGDGIERERTDDGRVGCSICHRFFHADRLLKHEKACEKGNKKRAVFDTSKQRALPEQEIIVSKPKPKKIVQAKVEEEKKATQKEEKPKEEKTEKKANWKTQHENFIENIKFNRKIKEMEAKGEDTKGMVAPTIVNENYVHCSYCNRNFAPATADRHIPKCKNTFNRPKPPKNLQLERTDEAQRIDRNKIKFILKKGVNPRMSPSHGQDIKTPLTLTPSAQGNISIDKSEKNTSHRSPQSNLSTGNYEGQLDDIMKTNGSPKENSKKSKLSNLKADSRIQLKKLYSMENTEKSPPKRTDEQQDLSPHGHEIKLPEKKGRDYRSQSPGGHQKEVKKVFNEAMPKKDELLQNYQNVFDRSSSYSSETCPHCSRKFAHHAAERHIPVCKNLKSRPIKKGLDQDTEEKLLRTKMYTTSLATKTGFKKRLGEGESPLGEQGNPSNNATDYERSFTKAKIHKSGEKPPLPMKKLLNGGLDANELIPERISILQKAKMSSAGSASFCTSCGTKTLKTHNFCGFCGQKK